MTRAIVTRRDATARERRGHGARIAMGASSKVCGGVVHGHGVSRGGVLDVYVLSLEGAARRARGGATRTPVASEDDGVSARELSIMFH